MDPLHTDIVHQMMQRRFDRLQLRLNAALTDLAVLPPAPACQLRLDMVKQPIHVVQAPCNFSPITLMFLNVNVLGRVQDLISLPICPRKTGVVLVVVMQLQAQLVGESLQAARQVIHMGEAAKRDFDGLGRNVRARLRCERLRHIIIDAVVGIIRPMVMVIEMRHYKMPIRVVPIGMMPIGMMTAVVAVIVMVDVP